MFIDSHCHLNLLDLADFNQNLDNVMALAAASSVTHMLCVCVELEDLPAINEIVNRYPNVSMSVGVHPNTEILQEVDAKLLIELASSKLCIAIGETGLDYFRTMTDVAREIQRVRFREHIRASIATNKPLIIHTREAAEDTLKILAEEHANQVGGVMHCFAEDWEVAARALDLNFYISFSGIVTFKSARTLQEVAQKVPLDKMLIETDAPYLAPAPHRGKQNHPALVRHTAEMIASLRGVDLDVIATATTDNFYRCFKLKVQP